MQTLPWAYCLYHYSRLTGFPWFLDRFSQSMFAYSIINEVSCGGKKKVNTKWRQCCSFMDNETVQVLWKWRSWTEVKYHCNYRSRTSSSEGDVGCQREHTHKHTHTHYFHPERWWNTWHYPCNKQYDFLFILIFCSLSYSSVCRGSRGACWLEEPVRTFYSKLYSVCEYCFSFKGHFFTVLFQSHESECFWAKNRICFQMERFQ